MLTAVIILNACEKKEYDIFATIYGIISDHETGEAIANASIVLSPGGKTKTTGTDGRFEFNDLEATQYTIMIQKAGYQTNRKNMTAISGEKSEVNIPLTKNK